MKYYVYLLVPESGEEWYYCGYTNEPRRRLWQHNNGKVDSTRPRKPYKMKIVKEFDNEKDAKDYEKHLKRSSTKKRKLVKLL